MNTIRLGKTNMQVSRIGIGGIPYYNQILAPSGSMEAAREALQAGKIQHIGFSSHSMEVAVKQSHPRQVNMARKSLLFLLVNAGKRMAAYDHPMKIRSAQAQS